MKFANANCTHFFLLIFGLLFNTASQAVDRPLDADRGFFTNTNVIKPEGAQFAQKSEDGTNMQKSDESTLYHVRCWQQGVLIVDEISWRNPQIQMRYTAMKPLGSQDIGLYLLDFSGAFCQLKKH